MGKVVIEVPDVMNVNFKAKNISDAIKKLINLKTTSSKRKVLKNIKRFKGIARYNNMEISKEEWYHQ